MSDSKINLKRATILGGSFIAFAIGSGYATGQENLQYFAAYGFHAVFSSIVFFAFNVYLSFNFLEAGRKGQFDKGSQVFNYFCGKYIGSFFDWFTILFIFLLFAMMLSGAGATLQQHFGIPPVPGAIGIAVLSCLTTFLGLRRLVDIIGLVGPVIIVFCILGAIIGLAYGDHSPAEGNARLAELNIMSVGTNWFTAVMSYLGFGVLMFAPFFAMIGKTESSLKTAKAGTAIGILMLSITTLLVAMALLANIGKVSGSQIPMLHIVTDVAPWLGTFFSIIIFLGIYSTACPLLWTVSSRLGREGTARYNIITTVLAVIACLIALALPFANLVNFVLGINGKVGAVMFFFIIAKNVRTVMEKRQSAALTIKAESGAEIL